MPKIKFTALVSDMKGKANGSVFSSNKGGAYFRTNKSGGGRKSESWAIQKSGFADLSSTWKNLTEEQQEAWKEATKSYPTTNAFGELRFPTGYELYMRINGTLKAAGQFTLDVPESPRAMPFYAPLKVIIPEDYLFTPRYGIVTKRPFIDHLAIVNPDFDNGTAWYQPKVVSMRYILGNTNTNQLQTGKIYELMSISNNTYLKAMVFMEVLDTTNARFWLSAAGDSTNNIPITSCYFITVPLADLRNQIQVVVSYDLQDEVNIYVNGNSYDNGAYVIKAGQYQSPDAIINAAEATGITLPLVFTASGDNRLVLGARTDYNNDYLLNCLLSDFRMYNPQDIFEVCSNNNPCAEGYQCLFGMCVVPNSNGLGYVPANVGKIYHGHILTTEIYAVGCYEVTNGETPNYTSIQNPGTFILAGITGPNECDNCTGTDFECIDGVCAYVGDVDPEWGKNPLTYGPLAVVPSISIDGENYAAQLSWTGLISNGKSLEQVPYKLLATLPISENSINISSLLLARAGNFSGEAAWGFRAFLLDTYTGQRYASQMTISQGARKKRPPGFKAGAELSGKVN